MELYEIKTKTNFEEVPEELVNKILNHFDFKEHYENLIEFLEDYKISKAEVNFEDEIIALPFTVFDLRGDGNTDVLKECLVNLTITKEINVHATGVYICTRQKDNEPTYATYLLDNNEILILEIKS